MSVLDRLATALDRNDERPNVALAEELAASGDAAAIAELATALKTGKKTVQNDAIKVLSEIGARRPELIAAHIEALFAALTSKNNRLVWGAMAALDTLAEIRSRELYARLPAIVDAAQQGSIIAMDKAVSILVTLAGAGHRATTIPQLLEILRTAAVNQFPSYAEQTAPLIGRDEAEEFRTILAGRLKSIEQSAKRSRVAKVLRRFPE